MLLYVCTCKPKMVDWIFYWALWNQQIPNFDSYNIKFSQGSIPKYQNYPFSAEFVKIFLSTSEIWIYPERSFVG